MSTGYVRLNLTDVQQLCMLHLISGVDEDGPLIAQDGAVATAITGYTEWITDGTPPLTIGWDWQMLAVADRIHPQRVSQPRSNVMLVEGDADAGPERTEAALGEHIDGMDWQSQTHQHILMRYSS